MRIGGDIARYHPIHRDALWTFLRESYGEASWQTDEAAFAWRCGAHPHQPAEGPNLWLCRRDGRVVGQQAGLPLRLVAGGRTIAACWAVDLMVAPAWRLRGVAPALMNTLRDRHALIAGLGISPEAHKAFVRAGWHDLGRVPYFVRLLRPLWRGQAPAGNWTADTGAAVLSRVMAPALAASDAVLVGAGRLGGLRFEEIPRFDHHAEALWQRLAGRRPVMACRDLAFLRWRFDAAPQAADYRRCYLWRGSRVIGYAVLRRHRDAVTVVDYLCGGPCLPLLFAHCLVTARRQGATVLTCLALPPATQATLFTMGFLRRPGPRLMVSIQDATLPADVLVRPGNWHVTDADSDLDHRHPGA